MTVRRSFSDYAFRSYRKRNAINVLMCVLLVAAALVAVLPLLSVFWYVLRQGAPALDWGFFTQLPKPVGEAGGGMVNALVGTATLVALASSVGIPWGIAVGLYLSEYGRGRVASIARFSADMLSSVPSIIVGLFVYAIMVVPMKRFSALAGGLALGLLMIPTVSRTTEELLKMVPPNIREAGLALGLPRWKVTLRIVLRGSMGPIITGVMLAIARVSGETAPLLFTAFNNRFWQSGLDQPIASLPVQIYNYAISPYDDWHRQAWAGAFVLVMLVLAMNVLTRAALNRAGGRIRE
ncbi:MAG TPA: phosphate ABC transporter permease PstA [Bdellovibrionota bacterium]|jgi:phosphate transport system permease protein|nr:phosphate ABC transporter permease PstA [Bdellovibrionota bacterium]